MIKRVLVSHRLQENGIKENHRGFPKHDNIRVFGADTETVKGQIFSFQLASQGEETLTYTSPERAFKDLMTWVMPRIRDNGVNLVFFHNLRFDATVIFSPEQRVIYNQYNDIYFERDGFIVRMLYGRVNTARIWEDLGGYKCPTCGGVPKEAVKFVGSSVYCGNPKHGEPTKVLRNLGTCVKWLDSAAFCPPGSKSLKAALKIYGVPYKKMKQPDHLGKKVLKDAYFKEYALNDARAEEALGLKILDLHRTYDISPCISLPQLSARILRHHFFHPGETFPFPPEACRLASELSYHAGKNGFYVPRGIYENVVEYDINSAFPKAMLEMPQMVRGRYVKSRTLRKHHLGIYRISGTDAKRRYPLVFDAAFRPLQGTYRNVWVTGYELRLFRKARYHYRIHEGWIWREDRNYAHSPLREFVKKFWHLKSTAPKGPERDTYKNILNSLYGKFAACVEKKPKIDTLLGPVELHDTVKGSGAASVFIAGSLYHPFIATQITGYVRAVLYGLEKRGHALHAATDSIKSFNPNLPTSDDLGGIKKEVEGRCYLFRNKLYLHFAKDTSLCHHDLEKGWLPVFEEDLQILGEVGSTHKTGVCYDATDDVYRGKLFDSTNDGIQHLCKVGLHGFKGSAFLLYRRRHELLEKGHFDYAYNHMVSLREGTIREETICDMTRRREHLCLLSDCDYVLDNSPLAKIAL